MSKNNKELFTSIVLLLLFWIVLSLSSSLSKGFSELVQELVVGIVLAFIVVRLTGYNILSRSETSNYRLPNILRLLIFIAYLLGQILIAGIDVARRVLRPKLLISPGVVKFRTPLHDELQIAINANSITLTPGTITLDIEQDEEGSVFFVHCISNSALESVKSQKGFLNKILNIYGENNAD